MLVMTGLSSEVHIEGLPGKLAKQEVHSLPWAAVLVGDTFHVIIGESTSCCALARSFQLSL